MSNQTKESRKLKDLIRIGVFSALWVVIGFLVAFTIGFFPPILLVLPCILGIIGGIVYVVMLSKLTIPGGIFISSCLLGVCLFTMAPYGMMFFCTVGGGLIGEILYSVLGRRTTKQRWLVLHLHLWVLRSVNTYLLSGCRKPIAPCW